MGNNQSVAAQAQNSDAPIVPIGKSEQMIKILNPTLVTSVKNENSLFEQLENTAVYFSKVVYELAEESQRLMLDNENKFREENFDPVLEKLRVIYLIITFFTQPHDIRVENRELEFKGTNNEQGLIDISQSMETTFRNKIQFIKDNTPEVFEAVRNHSTKQGDFEAIQDSDDSLRALRDSFDTLKGHGFKFQDAIEYLRISNVRLMELSNNYENFYKGVETTYSPSFRKYTREAIGYYVGEQIFTKGWFSNDRKPLQKANFYEDYRINKLETFDQKLRNFTDEYQKSSNMIRSTILKFVKWDTPILAGINDTIHFYFGDVEEEDLILGLTNYDPSRMLTLRLGDNNFLSYNNFEEQVKEKLNDMPGAVDTTFSDDERPQRRSNPNVFKFKIDYIYENDFTNTSTIGPAPPMSERARLRNNYNIPNERRFLFRSKNPFRLISKRSTAREYFGFSSGRNDIQSSRKTFPNGEVVHYVVSQFELNFDRGEKQSQRIGELIGNLETVTNNMKFDKYAETIAAKQI